MGQDGRMVASWRRRNEVIIMAKTIQIHLGAYAPPAVPTPVTSTPDAELVAASLPPVAVPAPVAQTPIAQQSTLMPAGGALAGGVAGFAVGGPIGAAIGAAIGYVGGKAVGQRVPSATQTVAPPVTPTVHGECCWNNTAGWAPHGDERMR